LATHENFGSERWGFAPACAQFKPIAEHGIDAAMTLQLSTTLGVAAHLTPDGPSGSKQTASVSMTIAFKINAARKHNKTDATTFPFSQPQRQHWLCCWCCKVGISRVCNTPCDKP